MKGDTETELWPFGQGFGRKTSQDLSRQPFRHSAAHFISGGTRQANQRCPDREMAPASPGRPPSPRDRPWREGRQEDSRPYPARAKARDRRRIGGGGGRQLPDCRPNWRLKRPIAGPNGHGLFEEFGHRIRAEPTAGAAKVGSKSPARSISACEGPKPEQGPHQTGRGSDSSESHQVPRRHPPHRPPKSLTPG